MPCIFIIVIPTILPAAIATQRSGERGKKKPDAHGAASLTPDGRRPPKLILYIFSHVNIKIIIIIRIIIIYYIMYYTPYKHVIIILLLLCVYCSNRDYLTNLDISIMNSLYFTNYIKTRCIVKFQKFTIIQYMQYLLKNLKFNITYIK